MDTRVSLTVDGQRYSGHYEHHSGGLPELTIGKWWWRGSSLGPANHNCRPDQEDRAYWRSLILDKLLELTQEAADIANDSWDGSEERVS